MSCMYDTRQSMIQSEVKSLSHVRLFATPWTVAYQAPPSMVFSRQEYWSGVPFPSPGDLPDPGIEPGSPAFQTDALTSEPPGKPIVWYKYTTERLSTHTTRMGFPGSSVGKAPTCSADVGSISASGRSPRGGHGNPPQYSCLENSRTEEPGGLPSTGL